MSYHYCPLCFAAMDPGSRYCPPCAGYMNPAPSSTHHHHHHHDYLDVLVAESEAKCDACQEASRRRNDLWSRPYRWVYDYAPPCVCDPKENA